MGTIYKNRGLKILLIPLELKIENFSKPKPRNLLLNLELIPISKVAKTAHHCHTKVRSARVIGHP